MMLPEDVDLIARYDGRLLGGVVTLEGRGFAQPKAAWTAQLYREFRPAPAAPLHLRLIPYYAWGNRSPSEMTVWMPRTSP